MLPSTPLFDVFRQPGAGGGATPGEQQMYTGLPTPGAFSSEFFFTSVIRFAPLHFSNTFSVSIAQLFPAVFTYFILNVRRWRASGLDASRLIADSINTFRGSARESQT
ncbi:hypothetical protein BDN70DRAFT_879368 [Pholiota conissans]|uniref:Uncharacterized protein n=1 Tax=Pholiota conissans TaxID=109636 RepID=A0A9P5Z0H7_9AGAR|nr:hypothetical protein BDN70DRAFT_879368 [Pholiota conissans]